MRKQKIRNKKPAKFLKGIPAHNEQIISNGHLYHDTKGWRKLRVGRSIVGEAKIMMLVNGTKPAG